MPSYYIVENYEKELANSIKKLSTVLVLLKNGQTEQAETIVTEIKQTLTQTLNNMDEEETDNA